jgi:hypothetical protein
LGAGDDELLLGSVAHGEGSVLVVLRSRQWARRKQGALTIPPDVTVELERLGFGLLTIADCEEDIGEFFLCSMGSPREDYVGVSSICDAQGLQTDPISNLHQESMTFGCIRKRGEISMGFDSGSIQDRVRRGSDLGWVHNLGRCSAAWLCPAVADNDERQKQAGCPA